MTLNLALLQLSRRKRHRVPQTVAIPRRNVLGKGRAGCTVVFQRKYPDPLCLDQPAWDPSNAMGPMLGYAAEATALLA